VKKAKRKRAEASGQQSNRMPSKGRTRQAHVKCQDTSGGPDRRANGKDGFLRRGTFGIGETAGVSACVGRVL
jgi:hypothetical protein